MGARMERLAVVTGANRGIGLEVCRQLARAGLRVILTCRDPEAGEAAVESLGDEGIEVEFFRLDVTEDRDVERLVAHLKEHHGGRLQVLVNNAGVFLDDHDRASVMDADLDQVRRSFEVNTLGPLRVTRALAPLLARSGHGRVVMVSSGMGQLAEMNGGYAGYRLSKTALNAVVRIFADELAASGVKVNSMHPGWVRTDMGGAGATRNVDEGADTITWLATLPDDGPTGGFFRDREPFAW